MSIKFLITQYTPTHLQMATAGRMHQSTAAGRVSTAQRGTGSHQGPHGVHMAPTCGQTESRATLTVGQIDMGVKFKQKGYHF